MAIYRARRCPKCHYYVGYWLGKPLRGLSEVAVKSFCLNCSYQFPVNAVVRGRKTFPHRQRRPLRAGLRETPRDFEPEQPQTEERRLSPAPVLGNETLAQQPNYARELRAIGQELEKRRFTRFNLKCSNGSYFVWPTENSTLLAPGSPRNSVGVNATQSHDGSPDNPATIVLLDRIVGVVFNTGDVQRLEREGVQNRRLETVLSNSRRLSHLLRTVGEEVYRRKQRLLAVAWQEPQISVVAENPSGRWEINVLRTDNLYDLWVRMYLQRSR